MSGPIVRKYGFANFDKIFGERELKHGVEGKAEAPQDSPTKAETTQTEPSKTPAKADEGTPKP